MLRKDASFSLRVCVVFKATAKTSTQEAALILRSLMHLHVFHSGEKWFLLFDRAMRGFFLRRGVQRVRTASAQVSVLS